MFRGRRLRRTDVLRAMVRETALRAEDLIMPYFVMEGAGVQRKPISSMPGCFQLSVDALEEEVARATAMGLSSCLLFGIPARKDEVGSEAYSESGVMQRAVARLKKRFSDTLTVITDVCLCEYTSHGHCGVLSPEGVVRNDATVELLVQTALSHARAGADITAPSDMMDGRVGAIRKALDAEGFEDVPVMSYAAKYASAFYGPFREAAESTPQSGNRKTYQMDPANAREALRETAADIAEGADILIVKPAGPYLDILRRIRESCDLPIAAYQVSGEYSMIKAAGERGWIEELPAAEEALLGIKRAGADMIITYFAVEFLEKGLVRR